jgi:hypothetical protein
MIAAIALCLALLLLLTQARPASCPSAAVLVLVPQELPAAFQVGHYVVVIGQARPFETATRQFDNLAVGGIAFS